MVARDDSVLRGSLITSLIFLVLLAALAIFLWRWGDTQAETAANAQERLTNAQNQVRELTSQNDLMKAMLGVGGVTEAEFNRLAESVADDPEMETILRQYERDMSYFGQDVDPQNRNYPALPEFLVNAIRSRNQQYGTARDEATEVRATAQSDVASARQAQQLAEDARDKKDQELQEEAAEFQEERDRMALQMEEARDKVSLLEQRFSDFQQSKKAEITQLTRSVRQMENTIETQRQELSRLRSEGFETVQGRVTFVRRGNNVVTINLGSADNLRPGVTFGVIDGEETRLLDADVKATIQVTRVQGPHVAEAKVVARPEIRNPIVPGDKIYSPFWAPGWKVKIALAGQIDIDDDGEGDNEAIKGMIRAAGAEVAAEVSAEGQVKGELDSSVRFLVVGESPDAETGLEGPDGEKAARAIEAMGRFKALANRLGITVIPAWKLESYLRTLDDTLTTPLGTAARGSDFPPLPNRSESRQGANPELPEIYRRQQEGMQRGNEILAP